MDFISFKRLGNFCVIKYLVISGDVGSIFGPRVVAGVEQTFWRWYFKGIRFPLRVPSVYF